MYQSVLVMVMAGLFLIGCQGTSSNVADKTTSQSASTNATASTGTAAQPVSNPSQTIGNTGNYTLTAWNDLGMHCMDGKDFSVFSILPPYNNLQAQLIKKEGTSRKHVTSGVTLTYEAAASLNGKLNTTSYQKTNFWDYVNQLFHSVLEPDVGLTHNNTPTNTPKPMGYNRNKNIWEATGLPLTPYNDDGSKNYYPLVKVIAKDTGGNILATTKVVLPVSDEMDCRLCHASNSGYDAAKPGSGWENDNDPEKDYKYNILKLHDEKFPDAVIQNQNALQNKGYTYDTAGLYATARGGQPILCASCHVSNALPGSGIDGIKPLTEAIHAKHAQVLDPTLHIKLGDATNRSACYRCHPGATTQCLRGAMGSESDIQCQSCHGSMAAVGRQGRKGWLDEPNCQACHQNGRRYRVAVTDFQTGTLRSALDRRFATNADTPEAGVSLYKDSVGHGQMRCEACHGSTHAIYPSSHAEDNIQSQLLQGHKGTIAECTACHSTTPWTVSDGPHGMHTIGQSWVDGHGEIAERNQNECAACHGSDYRGSELSKTFSARHFSTEEGTKDFAAGHQVSCYDCHNGPGGEGEED